MFQIFNNASQKEVSLHTPTTYKAWAYDTCEEAEQKICIQIIFLAWLCELILDP